MVKKKVLVQNKKKDGNVIGKIRVLGKVSAKLSELIEKLQNSSKNERKNATPNSFADKVVFAPRIKADVEKINIQEEQLRNWRLGSRLGSAYRKKRLTLTGNDVLGNFNRENLGFNNDDEYEIEEIEEEEAINDDGDDLEANVDDLLETYASKRRRRTTRRVRSKKNSLENFMNAHKRKNNNNISDNNKDESQDMEQETNDQQSKSGKTSNKRISIHKDDFDLNADINNNRNRLGYGNKYPSRPRFTSIVDYDNFRFNVYVSNDYKSKSNGEKNEEEMKKYAPCKEIDVTLYAIYEREKKYYGKLMKGKIYSSFLERKKKYF